LLCTAASTAVIPPPMTTTRRPIGNAAGSLADLVVITGSEDGAARVSVLARR
jgi:hypothetical protein